MNLRNRQTVGDGVEDGLDKMGNDFYRLGIVALDRLEKMAELYKLSISLDGLDVPFLKDISLCIGLEPKRDEQ